MQLLISDIDGTIYKNYKVEENIKEYIIEFMKEKNIFILATGRNFLNFLFFIKNEDIRFNYAILCNGAFVVDNKFNILLNVTFNKKIIKHILYLFENNINVEITASFKYNQVVYSIENNIDDFYNSLPDEINCLSIKLETQNDVVKKYINSLSGVSIEINNNYIDIIPEGINKGRIVSLFLKKLEIKKEDAIAIGDSENDFSMFEVVEESYYINDKLTEKAKYKIDSFNQFITIIKNKH